MELGQFVAPGFVTRPVRAFVPPGPARPRPLLILFDGQNVFGDDGSYAGGWHAHDAVQKLGVRTFDRPTIVALENGGRRRFDELGLSAPRFLDALADELVPRLRARFEPTSISLGGASLGGLASMLGWLRRPDTFTHAMVMSPSLWFDHRALVRALEAGSVRLPPSGRLYLDAGGRERGLMFAEAERMAALLAHRGLGPDRLLWRPDQNGTHHERSWRRRLPKALRFLYRRAAADYGL